MEETTWDEIRRLHTDLLNLQITATSKRYVMWRKSEFLCVLRTMLDKYILI